MRMTEPQKARVIFELACDHFNASPEEMKGRRRYKHLAQSRMIAMLSVRKLTLLSLSEVGSVFGGRDHSTVIHAERSIQERCKRCQLMRETFEDFLSSAREEIRNHSSEPSRLDRVTP